jgi:hypothetical protein
MQQHSNFDETFMERKKEKKKKKQEQVSLDEFIDGGEPS